MKARVVFWLWAGVTLANLGLFLQPLGPADFLLHALQSPLATLALGALPAWLFYTGLLLLAIGAADLLLARRRAPAAGNEFEDGWAFL